MIVIIIQLIVLGLAWAAIASALKTVRRKFETPTVRFIMGVIFSLIYFAGYMTAALAFVFGACVLVMH